MQEHDEAGTVNRRRLLRRAGTVAAGAAGVTVAGAMVSSPAQAAAGDPVIAGEANTSGTATTTLTGGSTGNPTLRLENNNGAALSVRPTYPNSNAPAGSVFVDEYGDFNAISEFDGDKYVTMAYSPTWAAMPVPMPPFRLVDTRDATNGRKYIVSGSASYDSSGRVQPKYDNATPDMIIDLKDFFTGGYGAVQANLAIVNATGHGYASLWDEGGWPGTSSINFVSTMPAIANFTQTLIGEDRRIRFKSNRPVAVLLDIVGFVVADPLTQLAGPGVAAKGARATTTERRRSRKLD